MQDKNNAKAEETQVEKIVKNFYQVKELNSEFDIAVKLVNYASNIVAEQSRKIVQGYKEQADISGQTAHRMQQEIIKLSNERDDLTDELKALKVKYTGVSIQYKKHIWINQEI